MPFLKKPKKEPVRKVNNEDRQQIYQNKKWKDLRKAKLMKNPLCEMCLQKGKTTPAIDVHHKDSFLNYEGNRRLEVAYNYDNLLSVCKECHAELHRNGRTYG